ncbi:F-box/kelch-repeat protein At3g06240-like [Bidens hawaiensis]|uniref:F-box/kelch-repeat protein At3g06240-like n=1 Tax=Bidens hawaiensis TaxID=980011 RepID=UPI0040494D8E
MSSSGTHIAGFGLRPNTNDPKIIALTSDQDAEVFTLSTKTWRSVPINMFHTSIEFRPKQVVIDGVIHWCASIYDPDDDEFQTIVSFDLSSEEFRQLALPDRIARSGCVEISKLNDSFAVIDFRLDDDSGHLIHDVWVMENGVPESSYTKLYTVQDEQSVYRIIGFRINGQPITALSVGSWEDKLEVYEPNSQRMNGLGINGSVFSMVNYTESLLLLDHPGSIVIPYN